MKKSLILLMCVLLAVAALSGCKSKGPMEKAGESADGTAEKAGEAVDKAIDKTGEFIEDAGGAVRDAVD